jgi:hypothetical protein
MGVDPNALSLNEARIEYLVEQIAFYEEQVQKHSDDLSKAYASREKILKGEEGE